MSSGVPKIRGVAPADREHEPRALPQALAQHGVLKIGLGFRAIGDAEVVGRCTATEATQLGKDEPHPVARLGSGRKFGAHALEEGPVPARSARDRTIPLPSP